MEALKAEARENWTLASDQRLTAYLSSFSHDLTQKTKGIVDRIDSLADDVDEADICLRNTFNEFNNLANSQFIENVRVLLPATPPPLNV
jgi:hypothetical protein